MVNFWGAGAHCSACQVLCSECQMHSVLAQQLLGREAISLFEGPAEMGEGW